MFCALNAMKTGRGLDRDALHAMTIAMEAARSSGEGPRRAHESNEVRDAAFSLVENFRPRRVEMRLPVGRIAVLIGVKVTIRFGVVNFAHPALSAIGSLVGGRENKFRPVSFQDALAFRRSVGRKAEFHLVTARRAYHGIRDSGITAGGIDDGFVLREGAGFFAFKNHVQRGPVLHGPSGIEVLGLGVNLDARVLRRNPGQSQQRSVSDVAADVMGHAGGRHAGGRHEVIWTFSILIQVIHGGPDLIRRLLIRPGAIGDFIVSMPAMESLRADYTEVWCAEQNVALARFADRAISIGQSGLDRLGVLPAHDVVERLRGFDSIISWYGSARGEFERLGLPAVILPALPSGGRHAVDFYNAQAADQGAARPSRFPSVPCPAVKREFAAIHPFASGERKRGPMAWFESIAERLEARMPVRWLSGPFDELQGTVRIDDLYDVACWLRGACVFVGNDSGIAHLAAAVGTPVVSWFGAGDARVWAARAVGFLQYGGPDQPV